MKVSEIYTYHEDSDQISYIKDGIRIQKNYGDISVKIDIYEDRVRSWFLDIAYQMVENGELHPGDYVAVMVSLSYIEGVQQFREGQETPRGSSEKYFTESAKRIFRDQSTEVIERLWKEIRCGLFHSGFTNGKISLTYRYGTTPIHFEEDYIYIHPKIFLKCVQDDFEKYISDLRNDQSIDLRKNFETLWNQLWESS